MKIPCPLGAAAGRQVSFHKMPQMTIRIHTCATELLPEFSRVAAKCQSIRPSEVPKNYAYDSCDF